MASLVELPCNEDGTCMRCGVHPPSEETLRCGTYTTPWHMACLSSNLFETLATDFEWQCPDCSGNSDSLTPAAAAATVHGGGSSHSLVAEIRAIEADHSLSESEKARKKQELVSGMACKDGDEGDEEKEISVLNELRTTLKCSFCMQLPEKPVSTPCGHNFCCQCFQKWIARGKRICAKCRSIIPQSMARLPSINVALATAIQTIATSKNIVVKHLGDHCWTPNEEYPNKAFTTEMAKKGEENNEENAKLCEIVPIDHFGPITAEHDPINNRGVPVGDNWVYRQECLQSGIHRTPVSGIAGQSKQGAQSVVLSGGYGNDDDHGEWFIYTGSGGRDLSGNKRTRRNQTHDQKFERHNQALQLSCIKGYPIRVVRSQKYTNSSYAPKKGLRYDGIYRVEKCWNKTGDEGFAICRYLFIRCDNESAPWIRDGHGDRPRPLPIVSELQNASNLTERIESPHWDLDETDGLWKWMKPQPLSRQRVSQLKGKDMRDPERTTRVAQHNSLQEKLLKAFNCLICKEVMAQPTTMPCGHNFCKLCIESEFKGKKLFCERNSGGKTLRTKKNVILCPCCPTDISDFLHILQVNRELMDVIKTLKKASNDDINNGEEKRKKVMIAAKEENELSSSSNKGGHVTLNNTSN